MRTLWLLAGLSTALLSSCAFAPVKKPDPYGYAVRTTKVVQLDRSKALDVARSALEGLGYEVRVG